VEWKRDSRELSLEVSLPQDLEAEIVLLRPKQRPSVITHNGVRYSIKLSEQTTDRLRLDENQIVIQVSGGKHQLVVAGQ